MTLDAYLAWTAVCMCVGTRGRGRSGPIAPEAHAVVDFWTEAGPQLWFAKDPGFDRCFRDTFLEAHVAAARRELWQWLATPTEALALILLLDQYPRNAFRGTPRMFATDGLAREAANQAIASEFDLALSPRLQLFFYLPLGHSEDIADQDRSVQLAGRIGAHDRAHAERHRDIIQRFGRFPHRNEILGRVTTPEEQRYLDEGGFKG